MCPWPQYRCRVLLTIAPRIQTDKAELERRESELKEKALRNKVVRTRKSSVAAPLSGAEGSN